MSLLTGKGKEVREQVTKEKVDLKEAYIRLKKENESVTVRVLGIDDYVSYKAHGDFNKGIYNSPCKNPNNGGQFCSFCIAKEKGGAEWEDFYAKARFIFAFGVLDDGTPKCLEVSKNQAKKLIMDIDEYSEEIQDGEIAFNLTRTGTGTSTAYSLKPLTPKKFKAIEEKFEVFSGQKIGIKFFEERLSSKTDDYMVKLLSDAGFPVQAYFDAELVAKALEDREGTDTKETTVQPVADTNEDVI